MPAGKTDLTQTQMQAMLERLAPLPPIADTLDSALISIAGGEAVFQGRPQRKHHDPLVCALGRVAHCGSSADAADGRLYAHVTTTCLLTDLRG